MKLIFQWNFRVQLEGISVCFEKSRDFSRGIEVLIHHNRAITCKINILVNSRQIMNNSDGSILIVPKKFREKTCHKIYFNLREGFVNIKSIELEYYG